MEDKRTSDTIKTDKSGKGLTPSDRTILKQSMIRDDKALKMLSKL